MDFDKEIELTRNRNMDNIVNAVSYNSGIKKKELISKSRLRHTVDARKMIYKLVRDIYGYSLLVMGKYFGKNHATIIHQIREHDKLVVLDKNYEARYRQIMELILADSDQFSTQRLLLKEKEYYQKRLEDINSKILSNE